MYSTRLSKRPLPSKNAQLEGVRKFRFNERSENKGEPGSDEGRCSIGEVVLSVKGN